MSGTDDKPGADAKAAGANTTDAADAVLDDFWNEAVEEANAALQTDEVSAGDEVGDDELPPPPPEAEVARVLAAAEGQAEPLDDPLGGELVDMESGLEAVVLDDKVMDALGGGGAEEVLDGEIVALPGRIGGSEDEIIDGDLLEVDVQEVAEAPSVATPPPTPPEEPPSPQDDAAADAAAAAAPEPAKPAKPAPPAEARRGPSPMLLLVVVAVIAGFGFLAWRSMQGDPTAPDQPDQLAQRDDPGKFVKPATDEPATDEPATDEPATDEPATDEPAADEPATDEPAADEPAADEPAADEPATDEPATDEPATDEPATDEPATDEPEVAATAGSLAAMVQSEGVIVGRTRNVAGAKADAVDEVFRTAAVRALQSAGYRVGAKGAYVRPYLTGYLERGSGVVLLCSARVQASKKAKEYERFKGKSRDKDANAQALADACADDLVDAIKAKLPPK